MTAREHGILFSGPMVRSVLDDPADDEPKTQTRRGMRFPAGSEGLSMTLREVCEYPAERGGGLRAIFDTDEEPFSVRCPYGRVGDRLWVRETWAARRTNPSGEQYEDAQALQDARAGMPWASVVYRANRWERVDRWRPSLLMPRWASRITLEITEVRVERLHDISDADIRAEGVTAEAVRALVKRDAVDINPRSTTPTPIADLSPRELWRVGWSAINGPESWDANPLLWCLSFRRVHP